MATPLPIVFRPAAQKARHLRACITGISGSGKTYTALLAAKKLAGRGGILVLDTEAGNSSIYAKEVPHDVYTMEANFSPIQYVKVLEASAGKYEVVVIDTITPEWNGAGGVLEIVDSIGKFKGWATGTPMHNEFLNRIVRHPGHIIATARCKMDHVVEVGPDGKQVIRKVGMGMVQREGVEHEFDVVLELDEKGMANAYKEFRSTDKTLPTLPIPRDQVPEFLARLTAGYTP